MPRVRLSWAAAFLAAVLIHAVVLAALSWKSDSDETESAASGGSAILVALSAGGSGDSATMVAPVSTASVAAAESTPLSSDTQVLPPPPEAARSVDPEALALQPPGDAETFFARAATQAKPAPPRDTEPVSAAEVPTPTTVPNDSAVEVFTPREVEPAPAVERETPLEIMETATVSPAPAAPTAAGSTAQALDAPVAVETVPALPVSATDRRLQASVASSVAPRETEAAAAPDRSVPPPPKEMTASTSETVPTRAATQAKPNPPGDAEPVPAPEVRIAANAPNDSTVEVVMPREVEPALAVERETPLEFMKTSVVPPAPAAPTSAGLTAQALDVPAAVETVLAPPASSPETPSEASVASSVAPREAQAQAAATPDNNVLPVTREIAATPPPPALPPSMNVTTSAPRSPADAENVAAQPARAVRSAATTVGGSTVTAISPREVGVASTSARTVLSQSAEIAVTAPAPASTRATVPASQQSRPPSTAETVGAPVSPTAAAEPGSSGTRAVPPREVAPAAAVERTDFPVQSVEVALVSSKPVIAQEAALTQTVPVSPPVIAAVQIAPDPTAASAVPPVVRAVVEVASTTAVEIERAVPRPVERPPRSDVASVEPPSEPDAQGQEPPTKAPGAWQSQKQELRADTEASSHEDEPSRSTGESGQPGDGKADAESPSGPIDAGQAGAEVASLAIDLTGDDGVPDGWSEYLGRLQTRLQQHKEYPRRARFRRQEGTTILHFVIDRDGRLHDYDIETSSGHEHLDRAVIDMIERARPFPPIPNHLGQSRLALTVPVQFVLR